MLFTDSLTANGQAFFPFFAAFTILDQQVQIEGVSRYKYKGQQVQIQRSAGTNTRVSRYKYNGSAGTNTRGQQV